MQTEADGIERPQTATRSTLTTQEEKVIRMLGGFDAPADLELVSLCDLAPGAASEIQAIEQRALTIAAPRRSSNKRKIVDAFRAARLTSDKR